MKAYAKSIFMHVIDDKLNCSYNFFWRLDIIFLIKYSFKGYKSESNYTLRFRVAPRLY